MEDAIAAAHDKPARIQQLVCEAHARPKVIRINTVQNAVAYVWHIWQIVWRNRVAGLDDPAAGRPDRIRWRLVQRRIEGRDASLRIKRRKIQLITQSKVERQL